MTKEITLYKAIVKQLDEGIRALKRNKLKDAFDPKTIKELDRIDKQVQKRLRQLAIEMITVPVTMKVMRGYLPKINETKQEQFNRVKEQTEVLYKELKEAVEYCIEATEQVLNEKKGGQNDE